MNSQSEWQRAMDGEVHGSVDCFEYSQNECCPNAAGEFDSYLDDKELAGLRAYVRGHTDYTEEVSRICRTDWYGGYILPSEIGALNGCLMDMEMEPEDNHLDKGLEPCMSMTPTRRRRRAANHQSISAPVGSQPTGTWVLRSATRRQEANAASSSSSTPRRQKANAVSSSSSTPRSRATLPSSDDGDYLPTPSRPSASQPSSRGNQFPCRWKQAFGGTCALTFDTAQSHDRHVATHIPDDDGYEISNYKCSACDRNFPREDSCIRHIRTTHTRSARCKELPREWWWPVELFLSPRFHEQVPPPPHRTAWKQRLDYIIAQHPEVVNKPLRGPKPNPELPEVVEVQPSPRRSKRHRASY